MCGPKQKGDVRTHGQNCAIISNVSKRDVTTLDGHHQSTRDDFPPIRNFLRKN